MRPVNWKLKDECSQQIFGSVRLYGEINHCKNDPKMHLDIQ